jgi:hypothetical protein
VTSFGLVRPWAPFLFILVLLSILPTAAYSQQIAVSPYALGFGNVLVGSSGTQPLSITNTGGGSVSVSNVAVNGTGYAVSGLSCPLTLSPGQSVGLNVIFSPPTVGSDTGSVSVTVLTQTWKHNGKRSSSTATTTTVSLSGSGIAATGQVAPAPAILSFGSLSLGTSQTLTETLTNTGTASVTVSQVGSSSAAFTASGLSLPTILGAGFQRRLRAYRFWLDFWEPGNPLECFEPAAQHPPVGKWEHCRAVDTVALSLEFRQC